MKKVLLASAALMLVACSEATSPTGKIVDLKPSAILTSDAGTVIVAEADIARQAENTTPTKAWVFYTRNAGAGTFESGPETPPLGLGSFEMSTPTGADKGTLLNFDHIGARLDDIDAISYSTYRSAGDAQQVASLNIVIDFNGDASGGFTTLVFEPVYNTGQGTVVNDEWQDWDAYDGGNAIWWSSRAIPGVCAFDCFVSWDNIVGANPDAVILGGFGINQGSGNPALTTAIDELTLGYSGNSVTYDFEDSCDFVEATSTLTLQGDCETTSTILIPNGYTLDGNGFTITARDPVGGHFVGAVIKNGGASASVVDLTVTASGLANTCDDGSARLRGIMFEGASGTISGNTVTGVRQGLSGCQEGNAIEVRNAPFADLTGPVTMEPDVNVTISNNTVTNYQKNGITANGAVVAIITGNIVTGEGPITYTAQNGIQVAFGATATVKSNTVTGNNYTPTSYEACGILLYRADGVKSSSNSVFDNEKNQCNYGKGSGNVGASN